MADTRWYNQLVDRLMTEQNIGYHALAAKAGVSHYAVRNARSGKHMVSMETLEKVLQALGFRIEPVPFFSPVVLPVKHVPEPRKAPPPPPPPKPCPDPDSYCWGCGKEGTLVKVHGHDQCSRCGYIDPCCED